ncbi:extracellular solute-binding protein [Methylobacterium sp. NEAU 140]|uniref:extracellular solute-binding protein n=1 Tax=Methylobacterium sp. NEAU 140 TaxID=3064945 RepID=UPI002734EB75|nr:extracellular solute-binding protein [Methylobacterium sp. NEAU 140]MDP4026584.1 extracellular solute-binding protein [Methylobacterium sp. NEAU 140]
MSRMTRRGFATMVAVGGLIPGLRGVQAQSSKRFDGVTLRVGVFGGGWKDAVHANVGTKLEAMGAKVEYVPGNPSDNFAKIVAARGNNVPIDVMEIGPAERIAMTRNGFLEDLNQEQIPNLAKTSVKIVEGKAVPYHMVQNGIIYRADRFKSLNIPVPTTLTDLDKAIYAGKTAFPDVANPQHWPAVTMLARANGGSESSPEPGFEAAKKTHPLYYYVAAVELAQKMSMGDVIAAPWHAGMAVRMTNAGQEMGMVHPTLGDKRGEIEFNYLGVVKGTKNREAATAFINEFLATQAQADFARPMGVAPVNIEARKILMEDPVISRFMLLSEEDLAKTYTMDWDKVNVERWRAGWLRAVNK